MGGVRWGRPCANQTLTPAIHLLAARLKSVPKEGGGSQLLLVVQAGGWREASRGKGRAGLGWAGSPHPHAGAAGSPRPPGVRPAGDAAPHTATRTNAQRGLTAAPRPHPRPAHALRPAALLCCAPLPPLQHSSPRIPPPAAHLASGHSRREAAPGVQGCSAPASAADKPPAPPRLSPAARPRPTAPRRAAPPPPLQSLPRAPLPRCRLL